jgi:hypothetical protein
MNSGWKLEGDLKSMSLVKDKKKLTFDIMIHTTRDFLFTVKIDKRTEIAGIIKEEKKVNGSTSLSWSSVTTINKGHSKTVRMASERLTREV